MTPITRQQQREIWQHFLTNVIQARTTATDNFLFTTFFYVLLSIAFSVTRVV